MGIGDLQGKDDFHGRIAWNIIIKGRFMKKYNYKLLTVKGISNLQPERLRELKERGLTIKQLAEKCEVSAGTISARLKELGLTRKYKTREKIR